MKSSARVKRELEKLGWLTATVEHYSTYTNKSYDAFGCLDLISISPTRLIGVQATSEDFQEHIRHMSQLEAVKALVGVTGLYLVGCKRMTLRKGMIQKRWSYRIGEFKLDDSDNLIYHEYASWNDRHFNLDILVELEEKK